MADASSRLNQASGAPATGDDSSSAIESPFDAIRATVATEGRTRTRIQLLQDHYMFINGARLHVYVLRIIGMDSGITTEVRTSMS